MNYLLEWKCTSFERNHLKEKNCKLIVFIQIKNFAKSLLHNDFRTNNKSQQY